VASLVAVGLGAVALVVALRRRTAAS